MFYPNYLVLLRTNGSRESSKNQQGKRSETKLRATKILQGTTGAVFFSKFSYFASHQDLFSAWACTESPSVWATASCPSQCGNLHVQKQTLPKRKRTLERKSLQHLIIETNLTFKRCISKLHPISGGVFIYLYANKKRKRLCQGTVTPGDQLAPCFCQFYCW